VSKKLDAVAAIKAAIPKPQSMRWNDRIDPKHSDTLREIEAAYLAGEFGAKKLPAHTAIAKFLNERGISNVGHQGVRQWLEKR
jgi:hypothetical protein